MGKLGTDCIAVPDESDLSAEAGAELGRIFLSRNG
jgi:hypothetical protein